MSDTPAVGFVGLGAMGAHLVTALLDAGHPVAVYDTRSEAVAPAVARGATACAGVRELADRVATVLVSLPTPAAVRAVSCGAGGLIGGSAIGTFVDLSTTGAQVAEEIALQLGDAGIDCLDAPVSGGVAGARARTLAVMASGRPEVFARVRPLLETFGKNVFHVGEEPGQGQTVKLLNNLLSATAVAITAEAMTVGVRAGLDPATLLDVFNAGSGRNTATSDKFPSRVLTRRFDAGFRLALMSKDVDLCLAEARRRGVPMLLGGLVQQLWALAAARSEDDADHTEIVRLFEEWAGVEIASAGGRDAG